MSQRATAQATPYEVVCGCGRSVRGERERRHQVVPCPGCGRALFVLPRSPWPAEDAPAVAGRASSWRWPIVAGRASAAAIVAGFLIALPYLARGRGESGARQTEPTLTGGAILAREAEGKKALGEGNFDLALRELDAAVGLRDQQPNLLSPEQHRRLNQLQREADLLDRLSPVLLEDVCRQAAAARDADNWKGRFDKSYRGKTILFDAEVGLQAGRPAFLFYTVEVGKDETARVALEDLALLRDLPLVPPQRLLFGARLASCSREARGAWVIRFQPDSTVLLTDEGAATICCPAPGLAEVLARQRRWVKDVGRLRPAGP